MLLRAVIKITTKIFLKKLFKDTLKAFGDFKNNQNSIWSNVFCYVKLYIFWKSIQYNIHWDKKQMLKNPSDKINVTINAYFFLSRAPPQNSSDSRFLNELKLKLRLSKSMCGFFHFRVRFVFITVYIFVEKKHRLSEFKTS